MTYEEYITLVNRLWSCTESPQRRGQFWMNCLAAIRLDLYDAVIETQYDPFYDDELLDDFAKYLEENW